MAAEVDSYRYVDPFTKRIIKAWVAREPKREIPWTPLAKPLSECRVALLTSAGLARHEQAPFDQQGEQANPWWGDPTHRVLPRRTTETDIRCYHLHVDANGPEQDLDCVLPLRRLAELQREGVVGEVAPSHYSIMGYILRPQQLLEQTTPMIVQHLKSEQVDVLVLVPV